MRSERDGNWILHLETSIGMLLWLTTNDHTIYADMKLPEKTAPEVHEECLDGNILVKRTKRQFRQVPADEATE